MTDNWKKCFYFVDAPNCDACEEALKHLEDIDDDADAVGVRMVKTEDKEFVKMYGIEEFPTVVYFEKDNPHIYNGLPIIFCRKRLTETHETFQSFLCNAS